MPIEKDPVTGKFVAHKPTEKTRSQVEALKVFGHTDQEIADFMDIKRDTLYAYYNEELTKSIPRANEKIANKLYKKAHDDEDLSAIIFWLKTRGQGKWRTRDKEENPHIELIINKLIEQLKEK